jgi:hypothetical protein
MWPKEMVEVAEDPLVAGARSWRHGELTLVDLIPPPVSRQSLVVLVGEDDAVVGHLRELLLILRGPRRAAKDRIGS